MNAARLTFSRASRSPAIYLLALSIVHANGANAAGGDLLWQDAVDGGAKAGDMAHAVAVFGGMVFAAGELQKLGISSFAIRAYDSATGALVWTDRPAGEPGQDFANDVDASEQGVVVCGTVSEAGAGKFGVRFYGLTDGHLIWEDQSQFGSADACDVLGTTVYVAGNIRNSTTGPDFTVRAYDSATGVLLWEDQFDGGAEVGDFAHAFSIASGRLYAVGRIQQTAGNDDIVIRSYDAHTGAVIWHQVFAGPAGESDEAFDVAVGRDRVFVAGRASFIPDSTGLLTWAVQAYSADTGKLLWADYHQKQEVDDIVVQDERVIAVGTRQGGPAVIRAYDARSGNILWRDSFGGTFSEAMAVDTNGQLAYLGGHVRRTTGELAIWTVRAVDLTTGARVWQDRFRTSKSGGRVNDLVVASGRVYAVGLTEDAVTRSVKDFFVRVYDAQ